MNPISPAVVDSMPSGTASELAAQGDTFIAASASSAAPQTGQTATQTDHNATQTDHTAASPTVRRPRVIAVMPAYNAASTLERTIRDIPAGVVDEIILVDDCSRDNTVELARQLGLTVIAHEKNLGYGGNQKTCYREALARGADYVVMIHPDYQYDSRVVGITIEILKLGICDVVLGSRVRSRKEAFAGGMPAWKYFANRFLTITENMALGQNLGDFHSGYRAYHRGVLETIPFEENSDDFVFDSQFLAQAVYFGYRLGDLPVPVRYFAEASSINFRRSCTYGLATLWTLAGYWAQRLRLMNARMYQRAPERNLSATKDQSTEVQ